MTLLTIDPLIQHVDPQLRQLLLARLREQRADDGLTAGCVRRQVDSKLGRPPWRAGSPAPPRPGKSPRGGCGGCSWPDVEPTICRDGVHFGSIAFVAGVLNGLLGERVPVR